MTGDSVYPNRGRRPFFGDRSFRDANKRSAIQGHQISRHGSHLGSFPPATKFHVTDHISDPFRRPQNFTSRITSRILSTGHKISRRGPQISHLCCKALHSISRMRPPAFPERDHFWQVQKSTSLSLTQPFCNMYNYIFAHTTKINFRKILAFSFYRRDGVVVRASASQSVDQGFIPLSSLTKILLKWYPQLQCWALGI